MNKVLRVVSFLILFLLAIGTLFKLMHWPGASFMLLTSNFLLVTVFLPIFFVKRNEKPESDLETISNILLLLSISGIIVGSTFKVMHWPGASIMLILGSLALTCGALPLFIFSNWKKADKKINEIIAAVFIGLYVSSYFLLFALNYGKNIINTYTTLDNQQARSISIIDELISQFDSTQINSELEKEFNDIYSFIFETKKELIIKAEGKGFEEEFLNDDYSFYEDEADNEMDSLTEKDIFNNTEFISQKDNIDIPNQVMLGGKFLSKENARGIILKEKLNKLKANINSTIENSEIENKENVLESIDNLIDLSDGESYGYRFTWEEDMFYYTPLVGTLTILTGIEHDVKSAELLLKIKLSK